MAELDLSGFITPREQPTLLYKLGEELDAQKKAAKEAAKEAKAQKAATLKSLQDYYDINDLTTNTIEDANIESRLQNIRSKAYQAVESGLNENQIKMLLSDDYSKLKQSSYNIKEIDRQKKASLDRFKDKPGIDINKFSAEWNKRFLDDKGRVREDLENLDPTKDYESEILTNGDIYNVGEAIAKDVKEQPKSSELRDVLRRDVKGNVYGAKTRIQTSSSYVPTYETDEKGKQIFKGVEPINYVAPENDSTQTVKSYFGTSQAQPLKLIDDKEYYRIKSSNPIIMGALNQETRKFAASQYPTGVPKEQEAKFNQDILTFQKAKLYQLYNEASRGFVHEDVEKTQAPVTKVSVSVGGAGADADFRNIWKEVIDTYEKEKEGVERGGRMAAINISQLQPQAGIIITDIANKRNPGRDTKYNAEDLTLVRTGDNKGYEIIDSDGNKVMPFDKPQDINPKVNWGTKTKQKSGTEAGEKPKKAKLSESKKVIDPNILKQLNQG